MNTDMMYPMTDTELAYIEKYGVKGIYQLLAGTPSREFEKGDMKLVKEIRYLSGRCWCEAWELYQDAQGKKWLRHYACDTSD